MTGWFELPGTEFEMVRWGYPGEGLYCNGIRIPDGYDSCGFSNHKKTSDPFAAWLRNDPITLYPALSVIDKRGRLQVDLSRQFVCDAQLKQLIDREHNRFMLALLLTVDWSSEEAVAEIFLNGAFGQFRKSIRESILLCSKAGYMILNPIFWAFKSTLPLLAFHIDYGVNRSALVRMIRCMEPTVPFILCPRFGHEDEWDSICEHLQPNRTHLSLPHFIQSNADTMWMSQRFLQNIKKGQTFIAEGYRASLEERNGKSCIRITEETQSQAEPFAWDHWNPEICPAISVRTVRIPDWLTAGYGRDAELHRTIFDLLSPTAPWIPYDMEERKKKFPKAFKELEYYIDRILTDREKERGATECKTDMAARNGSFGL